ncbi:MAG: MFS transporter [Planctomycetaceae bacterium]|nr:MFS transporter [Planctomycetaceae bacterium]
MNSSTATNLSLPGTGSDVVVPSLSESGLSKKETTSATSEAVAERVGKLSLTAEEWIAEAVALDRPTAASLDKSLLQDQHKPGSCEASDSKRPSFYYGWWMMGLAMLAAIATSPGQTFGVSIFNEPMRVEMALTHGQLALAYMLGTLMGAVPITWFGRLMDRHGIRRMTLVILLLFAVACTTVSLTWNWYSLVLAFTLLRMLGPGALSLMSANILPFWFHRRLGTVEGLRQTAMALAMAVIPAINLWLVTEIGWRGAYVVLGVSVLAIWPLYWFALRNRPADVAQKLDGGQVHTKAIPENTITATVPCFTLSQALRTGVFWGALLNGALYSLIHTGVFFCLLPILSEQDLDAKYGAWMLTAFAISLAVNQMIGGWLADRVKPAYQMIVGQVMFSSGLGLLYMASSSAEVLSAGVVMGAAQGYFFAASNPLWARYFGLSHLGAIRGFLMSFHVALSSVGPVLVGWSHDLSGEFDSILLIFSLLPIALAGALLLVKPPRICNT